MDDATIRKYAKHVWPWVDDSTKVVRVTTQDDYAASIFYYVPPEMTLYDPPSPASEYHKMPGNEAQWGLYRFELLDGSEAVLRLAAGREINTVFVKEDA